MRYSEIESLIVHQYTALPILSIPIKSASANATPLPLLTPAAAMDSVPRAFATAADIRTRAVAFLDRREKARENVRVLTTAFWGGCVCGCCAASAPFALIVPTYCFMLLLRIAAVTI